MAANIVVSNLSRVDDYILLLNGQARVKVAPLQSDTVEIGAGEYDVSVQAENEEGLPILCKPILMKIDEGKTVHLNIDAQHLVVAIYDEEGTQLNAQRGFLCGKVADGVYVENPIT